MIEKRSEEEFARLRGIKARQMRKQKIKRFMTAGGVVCVCLLLVIFAVGLGDGDSAAARRITGRIELEQPDFDVELLTVNPYSRPGAVRDTINGIVIHYTANPGSTAEQNRNYFENLKNTRETKASSHFIVGLEGEIIQCVPTKEIAYASNERNIDTISIEVCHPDEDGRFSDKSYESLVKLTAWLCSKFDLTEEDVIRHYDVTGKKCPLYYVEHEDEWKQFRNDVKAVLETGKME